MMFTFSTKLTKAGIRNVFWFYCFYTPTDQNLKVSPSYNHHIEKKLSILFDATYLLPELDAQYASHNSTIKK